MIPRKFLLALILLLTAGIVTSHAKIEIVKARWGYLQNYRDVKKTVEAYVRNNDLSFMVNGPSMGQQPNQGGDNYLWVEYKVNGKTYKDTTKDGQIFTFRGVQVEPDRPQFGFVQPRAPSCGTLRVTNQLGRNVLLYSLDRYGRWQWEADLPSYETFTITAQVGQQWRVTSRSQEEIRDITVRPGLNAVHLAPPPPPPFAGPRQVVFENEYSTPLFLYQMSRGGAWDWVARLEGGATYTAAARMGETWLVTDQYGRSIKQVQVAPDSSRFCFGRDRDRYDR